MIWYNKHENIHVNGTEGKIDEVTANHLMTLNESTLNNHLNPRVPLSYYPRYKPQQPLPASPPCFLPSATTKDIAK